MLRLRPILGQRPDLLAFAVSYMIPVIHNGKIVSDERCLEYGSMLAGLDKETHYQRIWEVAELTGAEALDASDPRAHVVGGHQPAIAPAPPRRVFAVPAVPRARRFGGLRPAR